MYNLTCHLSAVKTFYILMEDKNDNLTVQYLKIL